MRAGFQSRSSFTSALSSDAKRPVHIAIMNAKGGSGKTTLTTNLAAELSQAGKTVAIMEFDPQGSSIAWLNARPSTHKQIFGIKADPNGLQGSFTRTWQTRIPSEVQVVLRDTPAGLTGFELDRQIRESRIILIPIQPSAIDIRAAAVFIATLLRSNSFRSHRPILAVLANRINKKTKEYFQLETFLTGLEIPFFGSLSMSDIYLTAASRGLGISEVASVLNKAELEEWHIVMTNVHKAIASCT